MFWWNKTLEEFTVLYDFTAEAGDEWEIKVGESSIIMHVDAVGEAEYNGNIFKSLIVSDENNIFCGTILCSIGHLTSFFPEKLLKNKSDFDVYPNPTNDVLFVETCHGASLQSEYRITNLMGQTMLIGEITSETQQIDISTLPNGLYLLQIDDKTMKFIIEK